MVKIKQDVLQYEVQKLKYKIGAKVSDFLRVSRLDENIVKVIEEGWSKEVFKANNIRNFSETVKNYVFLKIQMRKMNKRNVL